MRPGGSTIPRVFAAGRPVAPLPRRGTDPAAHHFGQYRHRSVDGVGADRQAFGGCLNRGSGGRRPLVDHHTTRLYRDHGLQGARRSPCQHQCSPPSSRRARLGRCRPRCADQVGGSTNRWTRFGRRQSSAAPWIVIVRDHVANAIDRVPEPVHLARAARLRAVHNRWSSRRGGTAPPRVACHPVVDARTGVAQQTIKRSALTSPLPTAPQSRRSPADESERPRRSDRQRIRRD